MPYKRLIFILLYDSGKFVLSRNFRLQRVGDIKWLIKNYNFQSISYSIDELIVLDVTRGERNLSEFAKTLEKVIENVFVPVAAGGGINSIGKAEELLHSGADKIVVNTALYYDDLLIKEMVKNFGSQCVVASIDYRRSKNNYEVLTDRGQKVIKMDPREALARAIELGVGEILLNSVDRDGTGYGYDLEFLKVLDFEIKVPLIVSGGAGKPEHFIEGLKTQNVDAVATANLLNFIGNGLPLARKEIIKSGIELAHWDENEFEKLKRLKAED